MSDLNSRATAAVSKAHLVAFLDNLADSLVETPELWENQDLESFLRAWSAWLNDSDGFFISRGETPPTDPSWSFVAQMLLAARVYE